MAPASDALWRGSPLGRPPAARSAAVAAPMRSKGVGWPLASSEPGPSAEISIFQFFMLADFGVPDLGKHHLRIRGARPVPPSSALGAACSGLEGGRSALQRRGGRRTHPALAERPKRGKPLQSRFAGSLLAPCELL